jgi:hypothetical protein
MVFFARNFPEKSEGTSPVMPGPGAGVSTPLEADVDGRNVPAATEEVSRLFDHRVLLRRRLLAQRGF